MSKSDQEKPVTKSIFVRNDELSVLGFSEHSEALLVAEELTKKWDGPSHRVRVRLRSRTNSWDVVVKSKREVAL